jgi:16S rRNA (cytidine1402-2'-O)-methyltransferase
VATPIGNLGDLSPRAVSVLRDADVVACEDTRHTRKLLTHAGIAGGGRLMALHEHNEEAASQQVLSLLAEGRHVAVVSDAGTPGISDPGERLVRAAVAAGFTVEMVPGPSAVIAALVVSGLATDRFCFEGFLPRKGLDRTTRLAAVAAADSTVVLFESPHRVRATVADLAHVCGPSRPVALCRELTKLHEEIWRGSLAAAADHLAATEPRGEYVLVLEGAPPPPPATTDDMVDALSARLRAGETKKQAVAAVAAELRLPKRDVYNAALALTTDPTPGEL